MRFTTFIVVKLSHILTGGKGEGVAVERGKLRDKKKMNCESYSLFYIKLNIFRKI